jgi:hypothetical protein
VTAKRLLLVVALCLVIGCSSESTFGVFGVKDEEVEFAKNHVALFPARRFEEIEGQLSSNLKVAQLRERLEQMAALFPDATPKQIRVVHSHVVAGTMDRQVNFTIEYEFDDRWLLASVALQRINESSVVIGVHVTPVDKSVADFHRFRLGGKGAVHYATLAMVVLVPIFIVFTLIYCFRTPVPKRKWLWVIFILFGVGRLSIDWTSGSLSMNPIHIQILGAGASRSAPYSPWMMTTSLPLGAILFMLKRRRWMTPATAAPTREEISPPPSDRSGG